MDIVQQKMASGQGDGFLCVKSVQWEWKETAWQFICINFSSLSTSLSLSYLAVKTYIEIIFQNGADHFNSIEEICQLLNKYKSNLHSYFTFIFFYFFFLTNSLSLLLLTTISDAIKKKYLDTDMDGINDEEDEDDDNDGIDDDGKQPQYIYQYGIQVTS